MAFFSNFFLNFEDPQDIWLKSSKSEDLAEFQITFSSQFKEHPDFVNRFARFLNSIPSGDKRGIYKLRFKPITVQG